MITNIIAIAVFVIVALVIAWALIWGKDHSGTYDETVTAKELFPNIKPYDWRDSEDTTTSISYSYLPSNIYYTEDRH